MSVERLNQFVAEGRIIRGAWAGTDADGRKTACLLAALSPEAGDQRDPSACPADVMPQWLAHLTPWLNDAPSAAPWHGIVRRYADLASRWHALDAAAWRRAEYKVRAACVREAMRHTDHAAVLTVCKRVASLCEKVGSGARVPAEMFEAAEAAAEAAEAMTAADAAAARAAAAEAAAAAAAAEAAAADAAAARAAAAAAAAAADRLAISILDIIESEIAQAEANQ